MDLRTMIHQFVDLSKSSFDNGYEAVATIQDQTERVANAFMEQASWIPQESRSTMDEFAATFRKSREDFKKTIDEEFDSMSGYVDSALSKGQG